MKVTCLLGSPRKGGNTSTILSKIIQALEDNNATVDLFSLSESNIGFCCGCKSCYENGRCVQTDDVEKIVANIYQSQLVIIASPSYWGDVTAQTKLFIDRCTPYCNTNSARISTTEGTKGSVVVIRAGQNKKENENLIHTIEHFLGHLNIPVISSFTVEGIDSQQDLRNRPEILQKAYEFGLELLDFAYE